MEQASAVHGQVNSQESAVQSDKPFKDISQDLSDLTAEQLVPIRTGRRSYFTETWNQAIDMFNVAKRTGNVGQGVLAVLRIMFLGLATGTLALPAISVVKALNAKTAHASSKIDMTYDKTLRNEGEANWEEELAQEKGIIDRAHAQNSFRLSYGFVFDHTGHAKPDGYEGKTKYSDMNQAQKIITRQLQTAFETREFQSMHQLHNQINSSLIDINDHLQELGVSGSFHMAIIANVNGKKVAITIDAGDSTIWLVKKDGRAQKVTTATDNHIFGRNKAFTLRVFEVEKGDRVVGTTDFDVYLSESAFKRILAESGTANEVISQSKATLRLIADPRGANVEELKGPVEHDPMKASKSDDMGVFMLYV
ncbi:MAG: hypothetical protein KFB93_03885 [Simkaniaceae bacterium]|nr:MAG: hypothetical protein KFB93_03885 [Simkaniaceae bacterium]